MDLEAQVRAFAAVSRPRSFSAAARELGISQPAVSKHIADIERRLGVRLVERRPRGGDLTVIGEAPPKDGGFWRIRNGDGLRHRLLSLLVSSERSVGEIERELRLRSDSGFPSASDTLRSVLS